MDDVAPIRSVLLRRVVGVVVGAATRIVAVNTGLARTEALRTTPAYLAHSSLLTVAPLFKTAAESKSTRVNQ